MSGEKNPASIELGEVLRDAVRDKNLELVELLLANGADPNYTDTSDLDMPVLSTAIISQSLAIVTVLLKFGADPGQRDALGRSPMIYAAASGVPQIVKELVKHRMSTQLPDGQGYSARMVAVYRGHRELLRFL